MQPEQEALAQNLTFSAKKQPGTHLRHPQPFKFSVLSKTLCKSRVIAKPTAQHMSSRTSLPPLRKRGTLAVESLVFRKSEGGSTRDGHFCLVGSRFF